MGARWILSALSLVATLHVAPSTAAAEAYARIGIDAIGADSLHQLTQTPGLAWWVELDDQLLVLASETTLDLLARDFAVERLDVTPRPARLHLLRGARRHELAAMDVDLLAAGGRYAVVQTRRVEKPALAHSHAAWLPFAPNLVLARQRANDAAPRRSRTPLAEALADEIDAQRWFNDVTALAGFNRYTHGSGIDDARDWIVTQLQAMPGLAVATASFQVGGTTAYNVIATLTGSVRPEDLYIVGAHYDSTSQSPQTAAPGAEDNASGCAGVLEMARIMTSHPPEATILFICYSGEEQGLSGSADQASGLVAAGLGDDVQAMLNMDMIGFTEDADLDCPGIRAPGAPSRAFSRSEERRACRAPRR